MTDRARRRTSGNARGRIELLWMHDPIACNYDELNIVDDGSCFYSPNGGA